MDILTLKGLKYKGYHGFYEEERSQGNLFEVDLIFKTDLRQAAKSDDLQKTVNYEKAEQLVKSVMEGPSIKLIERLTLIIGNRLFDAFSRVQALEVRVRKLNPPLEVECNYSEVKMTWQR